MRYFFVIVLGLSCTTFALADAPVVKDLRKDTQSTLAVVFCSRPSDAKLPGHAMVVLGQENEGARMSTQQAFGFYPAEGVGVVGAVDGKVADEFVEGKGLGKGACRLIVRVDKEQFELVEKVRKEYAGKSDKLTENDCLTFVAATADALKLEVPKREKTTLPSTFIRELSNKNK